MAIRMPSDPSADGLEDRFVRINDPADPWMHGRVGHAYAWGTHPSGVRVYTVYLYEEDVEVFYRADKLVRDDETRMWDRAEGLSE